MSEEEKRLVCPMRMTNYGNFVGQSNECLKDKCAWWDRTLDGCGVLQ